MLIEESISEKTRLVELKLTLGPDTQRMCAGVGGAISLGIIGILPPELQLVVLARRKQVGEWIIGSRARDPRVTVGVRENGVRGPFLGIIMVDHFMYQTVIPTIVEFKPGIGHDSSWPQVVAASSQTDTGSVRRPNVLIANHPTVPLTPAVGVNRFL